MNGHYPSCPAYGHPTYSACHCTSIQISLDDLRAKVGSLQSRGLEIPHDTNTPEVLVWVSDVLALLDGDK